MIGPNGVSSTPFTVIGELTGPWVDAPPDWTKLRKAKAAAAERPEFRGNVIFVETRRFVRPEFDNAETYVLVDYALGKGMVVSVR